MIEQLPLRLDTTCRPTVEPPPGAVPVGPLELCASCGAFSTPYSVLIDDPLFCHVVFYRPDRREPLCLVCTIRTAQEFHAQGKVVDTRLGWALNERPIALSGVMTRVGVSNG